jgi:translation initiation factor RLI1
VTIVLLAYSYSTIYRYVLHAKKTAFVIEHDFIMATYLADRVIVFEGKPAISAKATRYVFETSK